MVAEWNIFMGGFYTGYYQCKNMLILKVNILFSLGGMWWKWSFHYSLPNYMYAACSCIHLSKNLSIVHWDIKTAWIKLFPNKTYILLSLSRSFPSLIGFMSVLKQLYQYLLWMNFRNTCFLLEFRGHDFFVLKNFLTILNNILFSKQPINSQIHIQLGESNGTENINQC